MPCRADRRLRRAATGLVAALAVVATTIAPAVATTDPGRPQQWALDALDAEEVRARQQADSVVVAVIDTGVDADHEDLLGTVIPGLDLLDGDTATTDPNGHGTGVAGVIAALVDNGVGVAGFAPGVRILPVRAFDENRIGEPDDVAQAIDWAVGQGADVLNLSFAGYQPSAVVRDAIDRAVLQGAVVVASSGNSYATGDNDPMYPAADSEVISVGAVDQELAHAGFSTANDFVDVAAPGVDILVPAPNDLYVFQDGTSFAAPYASALAALLVARYPLATPQQVTDRIVLSAADLPPPGEDDFSGLGLIDPLAALDFRPGAGCTVLDDEALTRVYDADRISTAAAAACTFWRAGDAPRAVIARADTYPDALAGTPLAATLDVPLLLTASGDVPPGVLQALVQIGVEEVTVLGGDAALAPAVETALRDAGIGTERVEGRNRYDTAAAVALRVGEAAGPPVARALVVTGEGFADAVAAGAYLGGPVVPPLLLTRSDTLPAETRAALESLQPREIVVLGGTAAIDDAVLEELAAFAGGVRRVSGEDRYATSAAALADAGPPADAPLVLATGGAFPDALAAGAVAGRVDGGVLLVSPADPSRAAEVVAAGPWDTGTVLGGDAAVSPEAAQALRSAFAGRP